jgi:hypothetical protein
MSAWSMRLRSMMAKGHKAALVEVGADFLEPGVASKAHDRPILGVVGSS